MKTLVIIVGILGILSLASSSAHSEGVFLGLAMFLGLASCVVIAAKSHKRL